ncbi:MAG: GNAT family N-acetyltransferase [Erysipelotrichaceae bacterium]
MLKYEIKHFRSLTKEDLFEIMKLRVAVFVVEQKCPYMEIDEYDEVSYHICLKDGNDRILAYLRVLPPGCTFKDASIGRVIAVERRKGYGTMIVNMGIEVAKEKFNCDKIVIEAQTYARKLYEKCGFVQSSEEFLEDGIPHIQMTYSVR